METEKVNAPATQLQPSLAPSYPPAVIPTGYFPPALPSHNLYNPSSHISPPSHYPSQVIQAQPSLTSSRFSPQTYHEDVPIESLNLLQSALDKVDKVKDLSAMADPLSMVASVVVIATAALQVSQTLYKLADALGSTNLEIESIALEVETFSSVLEDLRDVLDDVEDLITPKALRDANSILSKCQGIFEMIRQWLAPYKDLPRPDFWHNIQWTFRREKVKPLRCRLETLKTTLSVWLGTIKLARYRNKLLVM